MSTPPTIANARQYEEWNGADAQHWVRHDERYARMSSAATEALLAAAAPDDDDQVLDVGCGTGHSTLRAADRSRHGHVLGVDLSAPMLARARELAALSGRDNVTFEQADAQVHRFGTGSFDVVLSQAGVMFFDDPVAAFENIGDAMVPGGRMALLCHREPEEPVQRIFRAVAEHLPMPELAEQAPGLADFADPVRVRELLDRAGFRSISIEPVNYPSPLGVDVPDAANFLFEGQLRDWLVAADGTAKVAARNAVHAALQPLLRSDGVVLPAAGWLITAHWR